MRQTYNPICGRKGSLCGSAANDDGHEAATPRSQATRQADDQRCNDRAKNGEDRDDAKNANPVEKNRVDDPCLPEGARFYFSPM